LNQEIILPVWFAQSIACIAYLQVAVMRITGSIAFAADISRLQWIVMIIDSYILCLRIFVNISSTASSSILDR
jgi:hypothetical protein